MDFFTVRSHTSSTSWMLQSPHCSCGKHTGFFHSPRILLYWFIYMHACCHSPAREPRHHSKEWMTSLDDVSSPSGANSFCCAYCQASPAALVASPTPVASLSTWNQLISSNIHGDIDFRVLPLYSSILFDTFRDRSKWSTETQNVRSI